MSKTTAKKEKDKSGGLKTKKYKSKKTNKRKRCKTKNYKK